MYSKMAKLPNTFITWGIREGNWIRIIEQDNNIQIKQ